MCSSSRVLFSYPFVVVECCRWNFEIEVDVERSGIFDRSDFTGVNGRNDAISVRTDEFGCGEVRERKMEEVVGWRIWEIRRKPR
jgi:hypothetical protein